MPDSEGALSLPSHASQSSLWGTSSFKGCRFCRRDRTFPNPVVHARDDKPTLQFKSDRHSDCLPCIGKIRKVNPQVSSSSESRNAYAKRLSEDDATYLEHMTDLGTYEETLQSSKTKRRKISKDGSDKAETEVADEIMDDRETSINMAQETGLETRKMLGVLWPVPVYTQIVGEAPKPEQLSSINIAGAQISGVLRDAKHGNPTGTYEVTDFKRAYGSSVLKAASTETAVGAKEVDNTWKHVQNISTVSTMEVEKDGVAHLFLDSASSAKRGKDDFDDLLDFAPAISAGGAGQKLPKPRPKPKGKPKPGPRQGGGGGGGGDGKLTKQMKEIQNSDRVLLECKQTLQNLGSDGGLEMVRPKAVTGLLERLKNRLTPALCGIYTQGFDASDPSAPASTGMMCLENLRTYSRILSGVQDLVNVLHDQKVSGEELWNKANESKSKDFEPPAKLYELALQREVENAAGEKQYDRIMELLDDQEEKFNLSILSPEIRARFQEREITRLCVSLLRENDKIKEVKNLVDVALSRNALPANSEMRKEFELLKPLLSPMSPDVDQNELEKNASFLQSDKQLKLHKVICNFPTGLQILESSAQAISAKKKDALLQIKLQTLTATDHNVTVDEQNSLDYMVMAANPLRKVFEQYCEVKAGASLAFLDVHHEALEKVAQVVEDFSTKIEHKMLEERNKTVQDCLNAFIEHIDGLNTGTKLSKDISAEDIAGFLGLIEAIEKLGQPADCLKSLREAKDLETLSSTFHDVSNFAKILKLSFQPLVDGNALEPSVSDDNLSALISILLSPPKGVNELPLFDRFSKCTEVRLLHMLRKALLSILTPLVKSLSARNLLALMDAQGPGLKLDDVKVEQGQIEIAQKQCEAMAKTFPDWLPKAVPDFDFGFAIADDDVTAETAKDETMQAEGEDGEVGKSCLAKARVAIWMICSFPRAMKVLLGCQRCSSLKTALCQTPESPVNSYEDFIKAAVAAHAEMEEFKSFATALALDSDSDSDGKRILFIQKFVKFAEGSICTSADEVVKSATKLQQSVCGELETLLSDALLSSTETIINEGCSDANMNKLLEIAQSKPSKSLHANVKQIEFLAEVFSVLAGLKDMKADACDPPLKAVQDASQVIASESMQKGKTLNCCLATVQALARPLKANEQRGNLARRARVMITTRGVKIPPNLDMLLTKKAANSDKENESKGES